MTGAIDYAAMRVLLLRRQREPESGTSMHLEIWQWIVALAVTLIAALLQGTIGFGYAVLAVPVLALVDPRLVPVPQILSVVPMTLWAALREWRDADVKGAVWILAGRVPGVAVGAALIAMATSRTLDLLIGMVVLSAVLLLSTSITIRRSPAVDFAAGVFSMTTGYVSGIGGPPVALLFRDAKGGTLRATLGVVFTFGVAVTLTGRIVTRQIGPLDWQLGAAFVPAVLLGMHWSKWLHSRVEGTWLRRAVLWTSGIAALGLLARAALGR